MALGMLNSDVKSSLNGSADLDHSWDAEGPPPPPLQSYLMLTIFTCFCPAYPVNIVALVFSLMVSAACMLGKLRDQVQWHLIIDFSSHYLASTAKDLRFCLEQ